MEKLQLFYGSGINKKTMHPIRFAVPYSISAIGLVKFTRNVLVQEISHDKEGKKKFGNDGIVTFLHMRNEAGECPGFAYQKTGGKRSFYNLSPMVSMMDTKQGIIEIRDPAAPSKLHECD